MDEPIKLSPSDLTFLWDECKRCFYLKYVHSIHRPSAPFPGIFSTIDRLMKGYYEGQPTEKLSSELPPGVIRFSEKWVVSAPIKPAGQNLQCYIRGKFDTVAAFDDGSYGVVDFKTTEPKPYHVPFYSRQLHAYAYALENPAEGKFSLSPISKVGLLAVMPDAMDAMAPGEIAYLGKVTWLEIPRDDAAFIGFLAEVLGLLSQPDIPPAGEKCSYCQYREDARGHGM